MYACVHARLRAACVQIVDFMRAFGAYVRADAAEDPRRAALTLAQAERGSTFPGARRDQPPLRPALRTLSVPVAGTAAGAEAPAGASPDGEGREQAGQAQQQDPFRVNLPASAFELEERQARAGEGAFDDIRSCVAS